MPSSGFVRSAQKMVVGVVAAGLAVIAQEGARKWFSSLWSSPAPAPAVQSIATTSPPVAAAPAPPLVAPPAPTPPALPPDATTARRGAASEAAPAGNALPKKVAAPPVKVARTEPARTKDVPAAPPTRTRAPVAVVEGPARDAQPPAPAAPAPVAVAVRDPDAARPPAPATSPPTQDTVPRGEPASRPAGRGPTPSSAVFTGDFDKALEIARGDEQYRPLIPALTHFAEAGRLMTQSDWVAARNSLRQAEQTPELRKLAFYWRCKLGKAEKGLAGPDRCAAEARIDPSSVR